MAPAPAPKKTDAPKVIPTYLPHKEKDEGPGTVSVSTVPGAEKSSPAEILSKAGAVSTQEPKTEAPVTSKVEAPVTSKAEVPELEVPELEVPEIFVCDICGKSFRSQKGVSLHKAKKHK